MQATHSSPSRHIDDLFILAKRHTRHLPVFDRKEFRDVNIDYLLIPIVEEQDNASEEDIISFLN